MDLSESSVRDRASEYAEREPLYDVDRQHIETMSKTFGGDEYGRRDAQWIVRWYFRRYLGEYSDRTRRKREETFHDNDFESVVNALDTTVAAIGVEDNNNDTRESGTADRNGDAALAALTDLDGVDISVASAFLQFLAPSRFVAVDPRTWRVLATAGELDGPYPDPPSVADYRHFDAACRGVMDATGVDAWTLYRALWRSWPAVRDADDTRTDDAVTDNAGTADASDA